MEDILSSIKRIISEEGEPAARPRRPARAPLAAVPTPLREVETQSADDAFDDADEVLELKDPMPAPRTPIEAPAAPIISEQTASATRGAIDSLSRLLVKPEPGSDGTLEGLVREMLRPMLREWMDANLPALVETIVAREIAKLTGTPQ